MEKSRSMKNFTDVSNDLLATLLTKRIVAFLEQRPSDFAITILPACFVGEGSGGEVDERSDSDMVSMTPSECLSREDRSLLETSIVLMYDPGDICKSCGHLGMEARNLPLIARSLRKAYRLAKTKNQNSSSLAMAERKELFDITSCLLLIQPDHATAWADRRRYLLSLENYQMESSNPMKSETSRDNDDEDDLNEKHGEEALSVSWFQELDYLDVLVTQHSKAPSSWAHRKFVLRRMLEGVESSCQHKNGNMETTNKKRDLFFAREVETCISVAETFPKNYYAWTHRRYLLDLFSFYKTENALGYEGLKLQQYQQQRRRYIQLLETELMVRMWQEWLPNHPSDHSAVHYSCQVFGLVLNEIVSLYLDGDQHAEYVEQVEKLEFVCVSALEQVRSLLSKYCNENESLWILRRMTYKTMWDILHSPAVEEKSPDKASFFNQTAALVFRLVRSDLKSILSSILNAEHEQGDNENASARIPNPIYAWTFLAWCIANLDEIDDYRHGTIGSLNASGHDVIFTPSIREIVMGKLTSTTGTNHHNHLVYTSMPSPISTILSGKAKKI